MLRPELQTLVAAGATCQIRGHVDTYQREPAHGTVRLCLAHCTVRQVHHLQDLDIADTDTSNAATTDHLWVRVPAMCLDGRPPDPGIKSAIARDATTKLPTRLFDSLTIVGRLGYYTDNRGQLGMGVQQVLPVYYGFTLVAMLTEAATQWRTYNDAQAHTEAQHLLDLVNGVLRPAAPGQAYIDTPRGPALVLLGDGVTAGLVRSRLRQLRTHIGASYEAQRRAAAGHRRARAKALGLTGATPCAPLAALLPLQLQQPTDLATVLATAQHAATLRGYVQAQQQVHQAVPAAVAQSRAAGRRGFAA